MKKVIYILLAFLYIGVDESRAQSMTYNHDSSKQGQIQVMELGAGNLTPELYYTVTHRSYKNGAKAPTSVKNTLRLAANTASIPQVEYADTIQANLEGRAKIEALNIADRQVDLLFRLSVWFVSLTVNLKILLRYGVSIRFTLLQIRWLR